MMLQQRLASSPASVHVARRSTIAPGHAHKRANRLTTHAAREGKLPKWDECYKFLVEQKRLRSIQPDEAKSLQDSGYAVVDVRPQDVFAQAHPEGAVNVPMYQPLDWSNFSLGKVFRFIAYSSNGVAPVEPNPAFIDQMKQTASGSKGMVITCEAGGTLKPSVNFPYGKASRSLQAAYRVLAEGVTDQVLHLDRGVYGWWQADLPFDGEGEYVPQVGRTPMAAPEPTIGAIRESTNYDVREGDKK